MKTAADRLRGSSGHMVTWLRSSNFAEELSQYLGGTDARLSGEDQWWPDESEESREIEVTNQQLLAKLELDSAQSIVNGLRAWWLCNPAKGRAPNWDFVSTCTIGDRKGLILVEAKAHKGELSKGGKPLRSDASEDSKANHYRISAAIAEANAGLNALLPGQGVTLTRDSHYQLCNRVAWSWKLASLGVPNVLLYLGFVGDTFFKDCIRDAADWEKAMVDYMRGHLSSDFLGRRLTVGQATMQMKLISCRVEAPASPKATKQN